MMQISFEGKIWYWRGPAPHYFVTVPPERCDELRSIADLVTYGWGMIPVTVRIGGSEWKTSLFPKNGSYIVPLRANFRRIEGIDEGDTITVSLQVDVEV